MRLADVKAEEYDPKGSFISFEDEDNLKAILDSLYYNNNEKKQNVYSVMQMSPQSFNQNR